MRADKTAIPDLALDPAMQQEAIKVYRLLKATHRNARRLWGRMLAAHKPDRCKVDDCHFCSTREAFQCVTEQARELADYLHLDVWRYLDANLPAPDAITMKGARS